MNAQPMDVRLMNLTTIALVVAGACALSVVLGWWLLRHPMFSLDGITVRGDVNYVNAPTLRANVAPRLTGNFFTLDLGDVRNAFEAVPWVRRAVVRRDFPNRLSVVLQEHEAVALWGIDAEPRLLNKFGEVFDANVGDVEQGDLPRLSGPVGEAAQVLAMYRALKPLFDTLDRDLEQLTFSARGSWRAQLDGGAVIEIGRGSTAEVAPLVQRFLATLSQAAARNQRGIEALEYADLRHTDGYALRLRGVTTLAPDAPNAPKK